MSRPPVMSPAIFARILEEKRLGKADSEAAKAAGIHVSRVYYWMKLVPELREAFEAARKEGDKKRRDAHIEKTRAFLLGSGDDARFQSAVA